MGEHREKFPSKMQHLDWVLRNENRQSSADQGQGWGSGRGSAGHRRIVVCTQRDTHEEGKLSRSEEEVSMWLRRPCLCCRLVEKKSTGVEGKSSAVCGAGEGTLKTGVQRGTFLL